MVEIKSHEFDGFLQKSVKHYRVFIVYGPDRGLVSERAAQIAMTALRRPLTCGGLDCVVRASVGLATAAAPMPAAALLAQAAAALVGSLKLLIPLEGLIDLGAETARLDKELKRIAGEIAKCEAKLGNATFIRNAPAAVVDTERGRLADWARQHAGLQAQRSKLG